MYCYKNYIFDLDGTLINSSEEVLNCFKLAFKLAGLEPNEQNFSSDVIGPPIIDIIKLLSPQIKEEQISDVIKHFRKIYDNEENDISVMYDNIYEFLKDLRAQGCKLFIATFKPTIPTMRLVKQFNLKELFDDIYTIDKFGKKITKEEMISNIISEYKLNPSETIMIGDADTDIIAAHNAGIKGAGVLWGYGSYKENLIEISDYIAKNVTELRECLK